MKIEINGKEVDLGAYPVVWRDIVALEALGLFDERGELNVSRPTELSKVVSCFAVRSTAGPFQTGEAQAVAAVERIGDVEALDPKVIGKAAEFCSKQLAESVGEKSLPPTRPKGSRRSTS